MIEELIEAGVQLGQVDVRMIDLLKGEQFKTISPSAILIKRYPRCDTMA